MKNAHICMLLLLLLPLNAESAPEMTGLDIMQKQKDLHKSKNEFIEQDMILIDKSGKKEIRRARNYAKEVEEDIHRTLVVFLSPADIKGTALLTWQHKDQEDDQWLYLPAQGKMRRIAKGGKRNYFMGTDFTYEDLQHEVLNDNTYKLLKKEDLQERRCYVVEAIGANDEKKRESGYSKRLLWITTDHYTILKTEFYDRRGKLIKTQTNRDWVNVTGRMWRAKKTLMDNHKTKHKTLVGVTKREIDQEIDDQTFTERFILKERHIQ